MFARHYTKIFAAIAIIVVFAAGNQSFSQDNKQTKEVKIKTSAFSFMCQNKIESELKKTDGVEEAVLALDTKIITIKYVSEKITPEKLRQKIEDLGYVAEIIEDSKSNT